MSKNGWFVFWMNAAALGALLGFSAVLDAPCVHCLSARPTAQNASQALMIALSVALALGVNRMRARIDGGGLRLPSYFWEKLWGAGLAASLLGVPFGWLGGSFWDKWAPAESAGSVARYEPEEAAALMASIGERMSKAGIKEMSCAKSHWSIELAEPASAAVAHLERPEWACPIAGERGVFFVIKESGRGGVDSLGYFAPMYASQKEAIWAEQEPLSRQRALRAWDAMDFDAVVAQASVAAKLAGAKSGETPIVPPWAKDH